MGVVRSRLGLCGKSSTGTGRAARQKGPGSLVLSQLSGQLTRDEESSPLFKLLSGISGKANSTEPGQPWPRWSPPHPHPQPGRSNVLLLWTWSKQEISVSFHVM